ncbi:uncharacterized protein MYCFIDRAFT_169535 [Pseudocercospora fijiensis CIRAD86]|uniref:Uncharacterized protein n=1 Tax=Pseudocercospora fijiensis (strain CIRAD86) TaxID=383855 RepID=N1QA51_PSEFD|nr:uncharacterized protein MYCFIDRAFT_169535 [Pseudocercospora fijiensis CIRAD86]EME87778.1 hypothetical protein MYCFIDRAFT_169535 [Pseudocercospora fijiensis CIRAD86]
MPPVRVTGARHNYLALPQLKHDARKSPPASYGLAGEAARIYCAKLIMAYCCNRNCAPMHASVGHCQPVKAATYSWTLNGIKFSIETSEPLAKRPPRMHATSASACFKAMRYILDFPSLVPKTDLQIVKAFTFQNGSHKSIQDSGNHDLFPRSKSTPGQHSQARTPMGSVRHDGPPPAAAFRLVPSAQGPSQFEIPLQVTLTLQTITGTYFMTAEGEYSDFKLQTLPFHVSQQDLDSQKRVAQFFLQRTVDSPFRISIGRWRLYRYQDSGWIEVADCESPAFDAYFFLGGAALTILNAYMRSDLHILELVNRTIPYYHHINGRAWYQVEQTVLENIMQRLWGMSSDLIKYDTIRGASSYLDVAFDSKFMFKLGEFLAKLANRLNCFDLASLIYVALKSLGTRPGARNNDDDHANRLPQVFDVGVFKVQGWGQVRSGALFGYGSSFESPSNNPFYNNDQFEGIPQPWLMPSNDPNRGGFSQHCFTVLNYSSRPKVLDICHIPQQLGTKLIAAHDGSLTLPRGWPLDLQTYLDSRDEGAPRKTRNDLEGKPYFPLHALFTFMSTFILGYGSSPTGYMPIEHMGCHWVVGYECEDIDFRYRDLTHDRSICSLAWRSFLLADLVLETSVAHSHLLSLSSTGSRCNCTSKRPAHGGLEQLGPLHFRPYLELISRPGYCNFTQETLALFSTCEKRSKTQKLVGHRAVSPESFSWKTISRTGFGFSLSTPAISAVPEKPFQCFNHRLFPFRQHLHGTANIDSEGGCIAWCTEERPPAPHGRVVGNTQVRAIHQAHFLNLILVLFLDARAANTYIRSELQNLLSQEESSGTTYVALRKVPYACVHADSLIRSQYDSSDGSRERANGDLIHLKLGHLGGRSYYISSYLQLQLHTSSIQQGSMYLDSHLPHVTQFSLKVAALT